jgi:DHA2 family multidrug resistance protein
MMLVLGIIYFSSLVMMPQFLQTLLGYNATNAGLVLSAAGAVLLGMMPVVGQLTGRIQARFLIAVGWSFVALSMMHTARSIDLTLTFGTASWLRVMQAAGLPLLFVPITLASYVGLPQEKNSSAAGLINFMRNIGSSIGTSMVTTLIAQRSQFHQTHLVPRIAADNPTFQAQLQALAARLADAGLGAYEGQRQALARIYQMVQSQAAVLAYVDTFWLLGFGATVMVALSFALRKNDPRAGAAPSG